MALLGPASASSQQAPHQRAARAVYKELVEINTVDSLGSTTIASEAMAARFRAAGFPATDIHVLIPDADKTKGNLVVRYRGRPGTSLKPIMLLAHLDVVSALRSDWSRDPFQLQEDETFFYGRGASDDKAMAAMFVANLIRYKQEGWIPERDLLLVLTADEEGGATNGVEWLIEKHRALIDAEYAINEGGGGTIAGGKPQFHSIQAAEKIPVNFTLTVTNTGGHSSVPQPDNAIYQLSDAIRRIRSYTFPVALNAVTRPFFQQTARVEKPAMAAAMRAVVANPGNLVAARTVSKDPRYASMLRTTCVATRLAAGHANNALPQTATANVNCRIVPTSTLEEVRATLIRVVGDTAVRFSLTVPSRERFGVTPDAVNPRVLDATVVLTRKMFGDIPVIPTMSTGATDGRFLRAAGVRTYGVSGIFSVPSETNAHGRDEKLRVKSFYEGLDFLYNMVKEVAGVPAQKQ